MNNEGKGLERSFWFRPVSPNGLGVCRLLFFGWLFFWYLGESFSAIAFYPPELWRPLLILRVFQWDAIPSADVLIALAAIWKVSLLLAAVGLFTRASIFTSLVLGTYLLALTHSFGKINHSDAALLFAMGILLFSRCGDAFSVDRFLKILRGSENADALPASGEYHWPVQMIRVVLVLIFFAAGVAKVTIGGFQWVGWENFAAILARTQLTREVPLDIGLYVASFKWLSVSLAIGTVVMELAAPLALFSRVLRMVIIPSLFGMQIGILLVMGDNFTQFMALYLFWLPWAAIGAHLSQSRLLPRSQVVLFDGGCGFCRRSVALLQTCDWFKRLKFCDLGGEWPEIQAQFPQLEATECLEQMHVIDASGRAWRGFDGYRAMMWVLPVAWPLLPFLYLPGVGSVGNRLYRGIAAKRLKRGCSLGGEPAERTTR